MSVRNGRVLSVAMVFALWAAFTETGLYHHRAVAGPVQTLQALFMNGAWLADLAATSCRLGIGLALGVVIGLPTGLWLGTSARRRALFEPGVDFLRAVPPLLVFPLLLLAFGYGEAARVGAVTYASALVISLYLSSGVPKVRSERVRALEAMGASRWQIVRWLHFYEMLPVSLTAIRHAASAGMVVAVVTEMVVGAPLGLGSRAVDAQIMYDAPALYAVVLLTGSAGYLLSAMLLAIERRIVFWVSDSEACKEMTMRKNQRTSRRQWIGLGAVAAVSIGLAWVGAAQEVVHPAEVTDPGSGGAAVVDRVRGLFPQTEGWFRIVEGAEFAFGATGRIVPDYASLSHSRVRREDASGHTIVAHFASTFNNATRVLSGEEEGAWIDVIPENGRDVAAQIQDGLVVYADAYADTDVLYKSTPTHTDEYLLLRTSEAPTRWTYRVRLGPRIARLRQAGTAVEAVDESGVPWMRANAPFAVDRSGQRVDGVIRVEGDRLISEIDTSELQLPILVDPDWRSTGDMAFGRFYFGLNVLPSGRLLATGGCSASVCSGDLTIPACRAVVNAAETLDLDTRTWSRSADGAVRAFFQVSQSLRDGTVLVAGGCATPDCSAVNGLAEVYDEEVSGFRLVDPLPEPNAGMMSALLPDGRVLVAGGCDREVCSAEAHAFDPATGSWSRLAPMGTARGRAGVTLLRDGRVFVVGGCTDILCGGVLASAEVYDPLRDAWDSVGDMSTPRGGHYAATLLDGRVLVGGGCSEQRCTTVFDTAEVFDPVSGTFMETGRQGRPRVGAEAALLPDGSVMINQGCTATECDLSNERWDPETGEFGAIEEAVTARAFHETLWHPARDLVVAAGGCQPATCSWWIETYDVSHLMAPPDAGLPPPDAALPTPDAALPTPDAGWRLDAGVGPRGGGCGCRVGSGPVGGGVAFVLAFVLSGILMGRRRR